MGFYLAIGAALLVYWVLVWFLGGWLHLKGSDLWIFRGALSLLGLIAAGVTAWFYQRNQSGLSEDAGAAAGAEEVDLLVNEAIRRIKASTVGKGTSLSNLPLLFMLGELGSIKTSTVVNSGLDPELLAGQAYQDNRVLPTRIANLWYTRRAVFVDCGGDLLSQPGQWMRLVRQLQPSRLFSAMGKGRQAPRAVIVCYSSENFFKPGASEATAAAAKKIATRLQEFSRQLSINFPVYVLFTKLDTARFFAEYAQNLSKEEVAEILGITLPVRSPSAGVYAEEENRRLSKAFDDLFYSLAEKRAELLTRENEPEKRASIYEFPRELRKARSLLVQFLVDLARPSQLQSNPFLRGFYFSGVRAVVIDDVAPVAQQAAIPDGAADAGATRMFSAAQLRQQPAVVPQRSAGSRRVPQWLFLSRLFNDVILKDRVALTASVYSSKVNLLRRVALAAVAVFGFVLCAGFLVSFFGNRALVTEVLEAARQAPAVPPGPGQLASADDLQRLDRLRQDVETLSNYEKDGPPLRLRWGLYIGDQLYPQAWQLYFARFRPIMFQATQGQILSSLRALPDSPGPTDVYGKAYDALKAYLVTTSNNDKSTQQFLSPVLMSYWQGGRAVDPKQADLARQQFDFYSKELALHNPYSAANDAATIARARIYLSSFGGIDRYYIPLLNEAGRNNPSVSFNHQFADAGEEVVDRYEVKGAFTKGGFAFMQTALRDPSRYISGEEWVLGKTTAESLDTTRLQQELSTRYYKDFINEWRSVLKTTTIPGYSNLHDAENKLRKLSSPGSPLLELFWFVSRNTDVGWPQIKDAFQPVQALVPPDSADKYIQPGNQAYVTALQGIASQMSLLANSPTGAADPAVVNQTLGAIAEAEKAVGQASQTFRVDPDFHIENVAADLLEAPIRNANALIKAGPSEALNGGGRQLCGQFATLTRMYPFNNSSNATDLPVNDLNQIFAPGTGALWTLYDSKLKPFVVKQGSQYVANTSGSVSVSPAFLAFFNRAAAFSNALYPNGASSPHFSYSLTQLPSKIDGLSLKINSESLTSSGQSRSFTWTGAGDNVQVNAKGDVLSSYSGPWAVFHFISDATAQPSSATTLNLEWVIQVNGRTVKLADGSPKAYRYQLQTGEPNPFSNAELSRMRCVPMVAH